LKKINVPIEIQDLGTKFLTSDIWFVCKDKKYKKGLRPLRYDKIIDGHRLKVIEKDLRKYFPYHEKNTSFLRASFFNATNESRPEQILQRKEYTYYFKLLPSEIEKCLFLFVEGGEKIFSKGVQGFADVFKLWFSCPNDKKEIHIFIPFKVKPQYYIPELSKRIFFHGSQNRFKQLNKYSYVTPYKEDAIKFAIPWSSEELLVKDEEMSELGRPPRYLRFKRDVQIEDSKIYLYSIKGIETINTSSNTGKIYPWNRITLQDAIEEEKNLKLERKINSWKKELYGN
jgi:hypothetical protein